MYTRAAFEDQRQARQRLLALDSRVLAIASVGLGVAQLLVIRWADHHLPRPAALPLEGGLFLAYMALVGWLLWRMQLHQRAARLTCPACGVRLTDISERIAAATGRCDGCGAQLIE
jgi:hypothetical protein